MVGNDVARAARAGLSEAEMLSTSNLTALFHDMVRAAMAAQQVASSETTEFYLVQLLEGFARRRSTSRPRNATRS